VVPRKKIDLEALRRNVLIGESRCKDDRLDAQTLARLAGIDPQLLCQVNPGGDFERNENVSPIGKKPGGGPLPEIHIHF
jgi:hypothetical protein